MDYLMKKRSNLTIIDAIYKLDDMDDKIKELESELKELESELEDLKNNL